MATGVKEPTSELFYTIYINKKGKKRRKMCLNKWEKHGLKKNVSLWMMSLYKWSVIWEDRYKQNWELPRDSRDNNQTKKWKTRWKWKVFTSICIGIGKISKKKIFFNVLVQFWASQCLLTIRLIKCVILVRRGNVIKLRHTLFWSVWSYLKKKKSFIK